MLRKLLKYDFRSMWKQFSIIWPAALLLGLLNRFIFFKPMNDGKWMPINGGALGGITMMVFMGVMFAMFALSMVYILKRFYKGLLGDEGYLMHTLPVKTWQLVASKLICAVFVTFVNIVVAGLAMLLMMPLSWSDLFVPGIWDELLHGLGQHPDWLGYFLEFCLMVLALLACYITMMYLAMAIGHLFARRRVLMSVVAYFGLNILMGLGSSAVTHIEAVRHLNEAWGQDFVWVSLALTAIPAVLFFAATSYLLKNHLNLE